MTQIHRNSFDGESSPHRIFQGKVYALERAGEHRQLIDTGLIAQAVFPQGFYSK